MKKKILDVGCGDRKVKGAVGIDIAKLPGVDVVQDLNKYPWPFKDNTFDEVYLNEVIEHLENTVKAMEEIYRILKKGGKLHIRVVYWNHMHSDSDPTHVRKFNEVTWEFFTGKRKTYYTHAKFRMEKFQFTYDPHARRMFRSEWLMRRLAYFICNIIDGMRLNLVK